MPRVRARDYDAKAKAILDSAAAVFARMGYPNAKMEDIAKACGASKSMLYHYFRTKDELLYAMLEEHLEMLIIALERAVGLAHSHERLSVFIQTYIQKSALARRRHVVAINDLRFLPKSRQGPLLRLETRVLRLTAEVLRGLNPCLDEALYKPYALMLIGILNWTDTWYRPSGAIKRPELSERIDRLFVRGFLAE